MNYNKYKPVSIKSSPIYKARLLLNLLTQDYVVQIINYLKEHPEGSCVTDMYIHIRTDQSICSNFLVKLYAFNIVNNRREGKQIIYTLNERTYQSIQNTIEELLFLTKDREINTQTAEDLGE